MLGVASAAGSEGDSGAFDDLGSSETLCNIITAIPCGFVAIDDPTLAPDPSTYDGLPMYCNPECKERMNMGACS
eukprot:scaffold532655_cov50-Prasinocladus_malaysianus.AAC.1